MNEAQRIIVKQVVYDEFMMQIKTVRHSFNTTGTANYRVKLAVPPSTNNYNNIVFKKLTNNYTKKLGISTRVGTIVDRKKLVKQAGVVHNIKSIKTVVSLLCFPYQKN